MTDRFKGLVVVLEHNLREDDAKPLMDAISLLAGVQSVSPLPADGVDDLVVERRVRADLERRLYAALRGGQDAGYASVQKLHDDVTSGQLFKQQWSGQEGSR